MLIVATFQIIVFGVLFEESLGCGRGGFDAPLFHWGGGRSLQELDTKMIPRQEPEAVRWTFGDCFQEENTCLEERYNKYNLSEIAGIQSADLHLGSLELALFEDR